MKILENEDKQENYTQKEVASGKGACSRRIEGGTAEPES